MLLSKMIPSAQSLLIFEAAARHLNFTAAACELGSTQSAVSQQMRGLEQRLNVALFKRIYRGVALTDAGLALYSQVHGGFTQIASCIETLQHTPDRPYVNVETDFSFAAFWLLPRLAQFRKQHPNIEVRIVTSQSAMNFDAEQNDVSLPLLKLGDIAGNGWLTWHGFFEQLQSKVTPSEPVLTFNNYTLLIQAAIAGQGVGIGWGSLVEDLVQKGMLSAIEPFTIVSDWDYYLVETNPQEPLAAKQHFINWLLSPEQVGVSS